MQATVRWSDPRAGENKRLRSVCITVSGIVIHLEVGIAILLRLRRGIKQPPRKAMLFL